jgi:pimeloyl-ACP methyl ester carboxylesterase
MLWPESSPNELSDWRQLADDLYLFLEQQRLNSLVGAGHSMGATTTLRLALLYPDLFTALVLIDPVIFPPRMTLIWELFYRLGLGYRIHQLAKGALKRRNVFESRQAMFNNYRQKIVFSRIDDIGLMAYVNAMAKSRPDKQIELAYTPQWEARIYVTSVRADRELWCNLPSLKPPLLIIRGAESDTFWEETAHRVQQHLPLAQIISLPGATHLAPLEQPAKIAELAREFLTSIRC